MAIGDNVPARAALQSPLAYTQTPVTLASGHIAGTTPIVASNANRLGLKFRADRDFELALSTAQSAGMRVYASARDGFTGPDCPMGALYLATGSGFAVGDVILVWEA